MKIDNFRENDAVNNRPPPGAVTEEALQNWRFIRKGGVGGWKEYFSNENTLKNKLWTQMKLNYNSLR